MAYRLSNVMKIRAAEGSEFRLVVPRLEIGPGERVALIGPSGCGKSTLLDMLALVLSPSKVESFSLTVEGSRHADVAKLWRQHRQNRLSDLRKRHVGYVLQTGGLLPFVSVRENIGLSLRLVGGHGGRETLQFLVRELGITRHLDKLPGSLSVGERQRVAIARALVHRPSIVIADEPTASLDPMTAARTMDLFVRLTRELHLTLIIASHDSGMVEKLGLRVLQHRFHPDSNDRTVISEFAD